MIFRVCSWYFHDIFIVGQWSKSAGKISDLAKKLKVKWVPWNQKAVFSKSFKYLRDNCLGYGNLKQITDKVVSALPAMS